MGTSFPYLALKISKSKDNFHQFNSETSPDRDYKSLYTTYFFSLVSKLFPFTHMLQDNPTLLLAVSLHLPILLSAFRLWSLRKHLTQPPQKKLDKSDHFLLVTHCLTSGFPSIFIPFIFLCQCILFILTPPNMLEKPVSNYTLPLQVITSNSKALNIQ